MNTKLFAACAALSLALVPAGHALADEMIERQLDEDITVQGEAQGPGANVEINTDEQGNTTVRAEAGVTEPKAGKLVILDPTARTFQLEGNDTIYVAPQPVPLEPMAGEEVTIHTGDGSVTLQGPRAGEKYEIEIDEDAIGDDEIEIEREPADDFDSDGGVEIEVD